ncbi:hypothetical protein COHA_008227 [Chlorella ohadii]|uniref:DCD domain-containing protein n=1 Tax=Chlorella ohadii TaxID=2649997 RepID=A0AAD5H2N0_9CHLO|nr:hypothetical protein COHA_008227 [Chlorella ohadii]
MGAGRKTFSYDFDTRNETNYRFEQAQKNLGNQLGGVIFMCNNRTFHTCMEHQMFGLPQAHWCYVQYVRTGMPLFLWNFESKQLHGIFKAASDGEWELDPTGWTDGSRRTPYPCQVRIEVYLECPPLPLDTFKPLIRENMLANTEKFQSDAETRVAGALQGHLHRFDDLFMQAQKERAQAVAQVQKLAALQQENAALRQQLGLAPAAAPAAGTSSSQAAAAAAGAAPGLKSAEVYVLGGVEDRGEAGDDNSWLSSVLIYSPRSQSWRQGPDMNVKRGYGSSSVLGHHLYVMGGGNSSEWLGDCLRLNLLTGQWEQAPSMSSVRGCAGCATLFGRMYMLGGGTADSQFDTVEIFNPEINAWMPGPKLRNRRFSTAAGVVDGCVYVTGGYDGSYLKSAEQLDPREGKWQLIPDMQQARGAHACTAGPNNLLYVVGGYDVNLPESFMPTVEAFDPRLNAWVPKAPMQQARAYGAAAFAEGALWVIGGMQADGYQYNRTFERYDAATNAWMSVPLPPNLPTSRAFLTASVVQPF